MNWYEKLWYKHYNRNYYPILENLEEAKFNFLCPRSVVSKLAYDWISQILDVGRKRAEFDLRSIEND